MSRDYKSRKSSASKSSKSTLILGIFIGYTLGIVSAIGIWFYLEQVPSPFLTDPQISSYEGVDSDEGGKQRLSSESQTANTKQEDQKTRFDFYDILPEESSSDVTYDVPQVVEKQQAAEKPTLISPSAAISPKIETPVQEKVIQRDKETAGSYYLQVGSFRNSADADKLKARLALLGIIASVQSANLPEKGVWYRVRVGPFTQKSRVDSTHRMLRENGIDAQFIKVR